MKINQFIPGKISFRIGTYNLRNTTGNNYKVNFTFYTFAKDV